MEQLATLRVGFVGQTRPVVDADPVGASGVADAPQSGWLVLVYRVPSEPTRLRATVWRRLKGLGAIYLQNSAAALPASPSSERALRKLRHEILTMEGTAVLLACGVLAGEGDVISAFRAARDDEYEEIVDKCQDFLASIEKEFLARHFSFAELEENEVDHVKLVTGPCGRDRGVGPVHGRAGAIRSPGLRRGIRRPLRADAGGRLQRSGVAVGGVRQGDELAQTVVPQRRGKVVGQAVEHHSALLAGDEQTGRAQQPQCIGHRIFARG